MGICHVYRPGRDVATALGTKLQEKPTHEEVDAIVSPLVGGRSLHLAVRFNGRPSSMFVNEFRDYEGFELNDAATAIFRQAAIDDAPDMDPETLPVIKGTAVVFDRIILPLPKPKE